MEKLDLKANLAILTGDWGKHESDWFKHNGVEIAVQALGRAIEAEAVIKDLRSVLYAIEIDSKGLKCTCGGSLNLANSGYCEVCKIQHDLHCAKQITSEAKEVMDNG